MKPQPTHRAVSIPLLAVAAIASAFLAPGPQSPSARAAGNSSARAVAPPDIRLDGSPRLFVTTRSRVGQDEPVAWVVFRTTRHLHVPQQVVARAHDASGRSFSSRGVSNCIRSTIISEEGGAPGFKRGVTYRVQLFARATIRAKQRRLFFSRRLVARGLDGPRGPTPTCATR